jgi:1-deoxy-D-xylulose 5-phosphate reductoisomerase
MRKAALLAFAVFPLLAQLPTRVDVYTHPDPPSPLRTISEALRRKQELRVQQQQLDLARQQQAQFEETQREMLRLQERALDRESGGRDAKPAAPESAADQNSVAGFNATGQLLDAINAARQAHADFDSLQPIMRVLADALHPDWSRMTMPEYIECLYAVAKTATFTETARQKIAGPRQPEQ